jgi:hypothetical protein
MIKLTTAEVLARARRIAGPSAWLGRSTVTINWATPIVVTNDNATIAIKIGMH